MPTREQAVDAIYGAFNTAWSTNPTYPVVWPNKTPEVEVMKQGNPWAFVRIAHGNGRQRTLAGADGTKLWQRRGQFICEISAQSGTGTNQANDLAELVETAFRGKTINGVAFRVIQSREGGMRGNWFLVTVTVDFEYDEVV